MALDKLDLLKMKADSFRRVLNQTPQQATKNHFAFFAAPAEAGGADPAAVGALVSIAAAAGRTMSPVVAVVLLCARLTGTRPLALVRRVAPPLLAGVAAVLALRGLLPGW